LLEATVIQGLDKKSIALLRSYAKTGKCPTKFIEIMSCEGGCIGGPCNIVQKAAATRKFDAEMKKKE
jgi:iron only hydrogenase large subunit-like protein